MAFYRNDNFQKDGKNGASTTDKQQHGATPIEIYI
jgi:hypothetical protein